MKMPKNLTCNINIYTNMKHLKKFETNYNYSSTEPYIIEFEIVNKIIEFIKTNKLKYIDNIKIYDGEYYITLGKIGNYDNTLLKYKYPGDEPIEIMIGIPRNEGVDINNSILEQIRKLTEEDINVLHTKQASSKFNI